MTCGEPTDVTPRLVEPPPAGAGRAGFRRFDLGAEEREILAALGSL